MPHAAAGAATSPAPVSPLFSNFAPPLAPRTPLRRAITAATRRPEPETLPRLIEAATLPDEMRAAIAATARRLIEALRAKNQGNSVGALIQEYSLSSQEGVALMCLAEALLRIPDPATRDALIRDKISTGDWQSHLGGGRSLFVNATTWGMAIAGKLVSKRDSKSLASVLTTLIARCGEPVIRRGVDVAMRMMGEQFVTGQTIEKALDRARTLEAEGFRYSYDMLGEAATTAEDAERYYRDYENAIHAIGAASQGRGIYEGPGISIKLSALHPRYTRAKGTRVMGELLPRVIALARLAKRYDIGLNIDAEEADRLEISLDLFEALALDPTLKGWDGLGFVVQAYGKRCPYVIDGIIDLARRAGRRIMVRLVKGAYWDSEIKRAQVDGLADFPVYTRKIYTDVSYVACARKLLSAPDAVYPQFATHNAQTLSSIYHIAGPEYRTGMYEFQCLHGMGEPLYNEVVGTDKLARPCRIYAPVGTHETLLAYLVRRLLENGANSSFVNRISDPTVNVDDLVADPAALASAMPRIGAPHEAIALPPDLFGTRRNSPGIDLADDDQLEKLEAALKHSANLDWHAAPTLATGSARTAPQAVSNPANFSDVVGHVIEADVAEVQQAVRDAFRFAPEWAQVPPQDRAMMLERAADLLLERMPMLIGLLIREAGKSAANAISEAREAADFLRYYADEARRTLKPAHEPLGPIVCISPWNFPLAIFTGQVAAALAAGNPVLAKPANTTPLIAAESVRILHEAGVPVPALQFLPCRGSVAGRMIEMPEVAGVMFTGSTNVARTLQGQLAKRVSIEGKPIPLIAETGGQNAMIVDSSALAEQVVIDVLASAFDSAGQRCSALRVLCLQEDVADRILAMLKGAMSELGVGSTDQLSNDIGPVITAGAKTTIDAHIAVMRARGRDVFQVDLSPEAESGTFVPPTLIEIDRVSELTEEVFGPVLHVVRYRRADVMRMIDDINNTGYGLTFGLHTRLDETITAVTGRVQAGNVYVNRNTIGAVVGSQPFGGHGLSGTGPKAGGPLYLARLSKKHPDLAGVGTAQPDPALVDFTQWLDGQGQSDATQRARQLTERSKAGGSIELPGPVGERNVYELHPRGRILLCPQTIDGLVAQISATLATGNDAIISADTELKSWCATLPPGVQKRISWVPSLDRADGCAGALLEGNADSVRSLGQSLAALPGPLIIIQAASIDEVRSATQPYSLNWLIKERTISINTTAAGGNASLMAMA